MVGGGCCVCCVVGVCFDEVLFVRIILLDFVFLLGCGLLVRRYRVGDWVVFYDLCFGLWWEICVFVVRKFVCDGVVWVLLLFCG